MEEHHIKSWNPARLPKKRIASKGGHKKHLRAVKRLKKNIMR